MTDRTAVFIVIAAYAVLSFGILLAAAWFVFVRKDGERDAKLNG